jgi:zinc/manganese transport system substrate-binding protein
MKRHRILAWFMGSLMGLGLLLSVRSAEARLSVVGTLPDFAAVASELGGDRVTTDSLIAGTEDPHFVDAKPSHVLRVHRADLLICIGMGLESGWLPVLLTQARNGNVQVGAPGYLDASRFIRPKEVPIQVDRAMGDIHGSGNPHYYVSPPEMLAVSEAIYKKLVELDPGGRADYEQRWQAFSNKFKQKMAAWKAALAPLAGSKVVEYHKSWIYLLDWMGFVSVGALEPKPGIPPSPGHVSALLIRTKNQSVRFVFRERYHSDRLSQVFANKSGAKLLDLPTMVGAEPGITTIWDKWDRIVARLTTK